MGTTLTDLRPSGTAHIGDNQRLSVETRGEFLKKGTAIEVIDVRGAQIIVQAKIS